MGNRSSSSNSPAYSNAEFAKYYAQRRLQPSGYVLVGRPPFPHAPPPPPFHQSTTSLHQHCGTDSGYMTSPSETERLRESAWKSGRSHFSLNEAFVMDGHHQPPRPLMQSIPSAMINAHFYAAPSPAMNQKQLKKWHKKQKKILKKMGSMPERIPIPPHFQAIPPIPSYGARAYSMENLSSPVHDGYDEAPNVDRKFWMNDKRYRRNNEHFSEISESCIAQQKSSTSSGSNSNRLTPLNTRQQAIGSITHEHSRMPSVNTDRSISVQMQTPSPSYFKRTPETCEKQVSSNRIIPQAGHPVHERRIELSNGHESSKSIMQSIEEEILSTSQVNGNHLEEASFPYTSKNQPVANGAMKPDHEISNKVPSDNAFSVPVKKFGDFESETEKRGPSIKIESEPNCRPDDKTKATIRESNERNAQMNITDHVKGVDVKKSTTPLRATDHRRDIQAKLDLHSLNEVRVQLPDSSSISHMSSVQEANMMRRSVDYGSTMSSMTLSSNLKTEMSDIDFSWVNDVENRLDKEIAFMREDYFRNQMPIRYFGVDDHEDEKQEQQSFKPCHVKPVEQTFTKNINVYDGDSDSRKELSSIHSHVKSKAAMFDSEALKAEQIRGRARKSVADKSCARSDASVYIPHPDYLKFNPISVNITNQDDTEQYFGARSQPNIVFEEKERIYRIDKEAKNRLSRYPRAHKSVAASYHQNAVSMHALNDEKEILKHNSHYASAADQYGKNGERRRAEKSWRASVAY